MDWGSYRPGAELQSQDQTTEQLKAPPQHRLDHQEDQPAEAVRIFHFSEAVTQLSILVSGLERMAKELDARTLKVYFLWHPQIQGGILELVKQPASRSLLGGIRGRVPGICDDWGCVCVCVC